MIVIDASALLEMLLRRIEAPPYLAGGEQGALWNPKLRAGLFGLALHHSQNDIARAFLEGVCFELRRCVELPE